MYCILSLFLDITLENDNFDFNLGVADCILNMLYFIYIIKKYTPTYIDYSTVYLQEIIKQYNFKIICLTENNFNNLLELLNDDTFMILKNTSIIDIIYEVLCNNKKYKHLVKDFDLYFTNRAYIKEIFDLFDKNKKYNSIINLFSGTGGFIDILIKNHYNADTIEAYDNEEKINIICYLNLLITYDIDLKSKIYKSNVIEDNHIKSTYDLVICDIPDNIKNIIHAQTCNIIKKLKIRGTKAEPLILQLLSQIVNKNGDIILITSNNLLFGESIQHITTRQYIIENFSVNKIISLDSKKSIIYLTKSKNNNVINFIDKFSNKNLLISYDEIINNSYSFYINNYIKDNNNISFNTKKIDDIVNIISSTNYNNYNTNKKILYSYKFNILTIDYITENTKFDYAFILKDEEMNSNFYYDYLLEIINKNIKYVTKGKMQQLSPELILNLNIDLINSNMQNIYINQNKNNNNIIQLNQQQIEYYNKIKKNYIDCIVNNCEFINLSEVVEINHTSNNKNTISILKNSNLAGSVNLTETDYDKTTNIYFIHPKSTEFIYEYIYIILKHNENLLINFSNLNNTINLPKTKLENLKIPKLSKEMQEEIVLKVSNINNHIDMIQKYNNSIDNLNILSLIN